MAPVKLIKDVLGCLELAKKARKQLIIFAPDFSDAVKSTLIYNNVKKTVECACVSVPLYGDMGEKFLKQISKITNSYLFTEYSEHKI
jgi:chaperonin GroEL (HSP60 family)